MPERKTGLWIEELAAPYYVFKAAGHSVTLASPAGGTPPIDAGSKGEGFYTADCKKFMEEDEEAKKMFASTVKLSECDMANFDAIFYPGGHGPLWDLVTDDKSISLIEAADKAGKPIGAVCHGPCVFKNVKGKGGDSILKGKKCTGFTNVEEGQVQLTEWVPFLLEDAMKELGGTFSCADPWNSHVQADGNLVTGQNPQSSPATAQEFVKLVK
uniref:DJ-1/PfpI domain-containing protein n=1 Tax=Hemiselmis andersenii TaxID=464988 RepID=A0A6U4NH16_HEMAN